MLAIDDEGEVGETEIPGFMPGQTLFTTNTIGNTVVQATAEGVRLVDSATLAALSTWLAPEGSVVTVATSNPTQCAVALSARGGAMMGDDDEEEGARPCLVLLGISSSTRSLSELKR